MCLNKAKQLVLVILSAYALVSCGKATKPEPMAPNEQAVTEATSGNVDSTTELSLPSEYDVPLMNEIGEDQYLLQVGGKKHDYTGSFELTQDLRAVIETLFLYDRDFDAVQIQQKDHWKEGFIRSFLQNSWLGYDYLSYIADKDSKMDKDEIEFVHYSLTGKYREFDEYTDTLLDVSQASSGFNTAHIIDYEVKENSDSVELTANVGVCQGVSDDYDSTYKAEILLVRNPYSCFDGYSIKSITSEETTEYPQPDGKEHKIYAWFLDSYEDEKLIEFEVSHADEEIDANKNFSHTVVVDISENPEIYDFVKEHEEDSNYYTYEITFIFDENNPAPFQTIKPVSVDVVNE